MCCNYVINELQCNISHNYSLDTDLAIHNWCIDLMLSTDNKSMRTILVVSISTLNKTRPSCLPLHAGLLSYTINHVICSFNFSSYYVIHKFWIHKFHLMFWFSNISCYRTRCVLPPHIELTTVIYSSSNLYLYNQQSGKPIKDTITVIEIPWPVHIIFTRS